MAVLGEDMIRIEYKKKYLVTGGSGFLGGELITRILDQGGEVVTAVSYTHLTLPTTPYV